MPPKKTTRTRSTPKRKANDADIESEQKRDGAPPTPEAVRQAGDVNDRPVTRSAWKVVNVKQGEPEPPKAQKTIQEKMSDFNRLFPLPSGFPTTGPAGRQISVPPDGNVDPQPPRRASVSAANTKNQQSSRPATGKDDPPDFLLSPMERAKRDLRLRTESMERAKEQANRRPSAGGQVSKKVELAWPFVGDTKTVSHLRWGFRQDPFLPYTDAQVASRPAWYDTTQHMAEVRGMLPRLFPGFRYRDNYKTGQIFGEDAMFAIANLVNLEGRLVGGGWLYDEDIFAGLQFMLQDLQHLIWISNLHAWSLGTQAFVSRTPEDVARLVDSRFHVWPINEGGVHWALAIYDQKEGVVRWMDSMRKARTKTNAAVFVKEYWNFLGHHGSRHHWKEPPRVVIMTVPEQVLGWTCGLHVLENARMYFRENAAGDGRNLSWHHSEWMLDRREASEKVLTLQDLETALRFDWALFCRAELCQEGGIRDPVYPTIQWELRGQYFNTPNKTAGDQEDAKETKEDESGPAAWGTGRPIDNTLDTDVASGAAPRKVDLPTHGGPPDQNPGMGPKRVKGRTKPEAKPASSPVKSSTSRLIKPPPPKPKGTRTYPHTTSPDRFIEPSHKKGWVGWSLWIEGQMDDSRAREDERRKLAELERFDRMEARDRKRRGLPPADTWEEEDEE